MLDFVKCFVLDYHYYLPKEQVTMYSTGDERTTEYLQCSKCGNIYQYPFGEYWHRNSDLKKHNDAHARRSNELS